MNGGGLEMIILFQFEKILIGLMFWNIHQILKRLFYISFQLSYPFGGFKRERERDSGVELSILCILSVLVWTSLH